MPPHGYVLKSHSSERIRSSCRSSEGAGTRRDAGQDRVKLRRTPCQAKGKHLIGRATREQDLAAFGKPEVRSTLPSMDREISFRKPRVCRQQSTRHVHFFLTFDADGGARGEATAGEAAAGDLFKYFAIGMS